MITRNIRRIGIVSALLGVGLGWALDAQAQFTGRSTRSSSSSSRGSTRQYNSAGMIGDAMISSDPESRRIIVIADEDTNLAISQVITNLDKPKPQVLIKVAFIEVTQDNGLNVGVDGSYTHKISNTSTGSLSTLFGVTESLTKQTGSGGFYRVLADDFQITLNALATATKMEVLSRPSVLARNNQSATIMVGQTIPLVTNTRYDAVNGQINTVSWTDIGIILRVTPFITSDNMVEMIIAPEISTLADSTVQIATGVDAKFINKRSADTVVVTPDGMPVVIGGMMENKKTDVTKKIPILGDIPLLGLAFRHKEKGDSKTELIIILTPHIVSTPAQLASMSQREREQAVLTPKSFSEKELDRFVDGLPVKKDTVPGAKDDSTLKDGTKGKKSKTTPPMGGAKY